MTLASLSVVLYVVLHLLCASSGERVVIPDDETMLIQFQTTMDHRSSDEAANMSEHLAAKLLPILTELPNMSKTATAALDPVHEICNQENMWISPLMSWLRVTLDESSQQIDAILDESLVMEENLLKILRNKTLSVNQQLHFAEVTFSKGLLPGGIVDTRLMRAVAPMNLGGYLHLDRYRVTAPSIGWNATSHNLLMKGLVQKIQAKFNATDRGASANPTEPIKQLTALMQAGMAQMGSRGRAVGVRFANLTGTLSKDMGAVMPLECSSVYDKPIGDANTTIDMLQKSIEMKFTQLTSGVLEATKLLLL